MFLSVVICTYNRSEYLALALDNLLESTLGQDKYELLVIDNNSSDNTQFVVANYKEKFKNLKYIFEKQQGLSYARNRALREAWGDYILYLDDDALINEQGLENLLRFLKENHKTTILGGKCNIRYEIEKPEWITTKVEGWMGDCNFGSRTIKVTPENIKKKRVKSPIGACFCIEKEFLKSVGGFHPKLGRVGEKMYAGEETLLVQLALKKGREVVYYPKISVEHIIQTSWLDKDFMLNKTFCYGVSNLLVEKKLGRKFFSLFKYFMFRFLFLSKNFLDLAKYNLTFNEQKVFETKLLRNFNFGVVKTYLTGVKID